jgi:hypothetical protein
MNAGKTLPPLRAATRTAKLVFSSIAQVTLTKSKKLSRSIGPRARVPAHPLKKLAKGVGLSIAAPDAAHPSAEMVPQSVKGFFTSDKPDRHTKALSPLR